MSGHSKWATTKRQKAVVDAKKGAIFTKLGNIISIAARKGGNPETNFSLRVAIDKARSANMPKENIERAIKRGTGEIAGQIIEELIYEGYGPTKSQFIIKCLTDNKNRSVANIRHIFTKYGGSMANVLWNFNQKGVIRILKEELNINIEELELKLIDAGVEDILKEDEGITIYTSINDLQKIKQILEEKKIKTETSDIEFIAKEEQSLEESNKENFLKFINELEDSEDVTDYYHNISNI